MFTIRLPFRWPPMMCQAASAMPPNPCAITVECEPTKTAYLTGPLSARLAWNCSDMAASKIHDPIPTWMSR